MEGDPRPIPVMTPALKQKLIPVLTGVLILIIITVACFVYFDRFFSKPVQIKDIKIDASAALKLNVLKQISKKNGITEWELEASSATLLKNEDKAVLLDVSVIFYTKAHKRVHLSSEKGILHTKTHDMIFSDTVVVQYETSVLRTDKLHYKKKEHIIYSHDPVVLERKDSIVEADSMTTRLNENVTILKGHVKGRFSENFKIQ